MILLTYPGRASAKSGYGDFIPHVDIDRITKILIEWKEKLSRMVDHVELKKYDYNISPSRYILTGVTETCRPLSKFVADLDVIEAETRETYKALQVILRGIEI